MKGFRRKRGFVLPATLTVIVILAIMAGARLFFSRQHLNVVAKLSDHERAYQVSVSGLVAARAILEEAVAFINSPDPASFPKREKAPDGIKGIVRELIDDKGNFRSDETEFDLESSITDHLKRNFRDVENVLITVKLGRGTPLYIEGGHLRDFELSNGQSDSGRTFMRVDGREANYALSVMVKTKLGNSKCSVGSFTECRLVNVLPPVIGKFTLFLRSRAGLVVNLLQDAAEARDFKIFPVTLDNGSSVPRDAKLSPEKMRDILDSQGWVHLGGDSQWRFAMTYAGKNANGSDGPLNDGYYYYPIDPGQPLSATASLRYYATCSQLHPGLGEMPFGEALKLMRRDEYALTSVLNLFGASAALSPTIVVGNVSRAFGLMQGIYNMSSQKYAPLPWLDGPAFSSSTWPGGMSATTVDTLKDNFGRDHQRYCERMCDILTESYNVSNLLFIDTKLPDADKMVIFDPDEVKRALPDLPASRRLRAGGSPSAFYRAVCDNRISVYGDNGKMVFHGDDPSKFYEKQFLSHKAGHVYESQAEFYKRHFDQQKKTIALSGIVRIKGGLDIRERASVPSGSGGMIIADGDIRVKAPLRSADSEPVTLLSLKGSITVETGERVDAALIALSGRVSLPQSFHIKGLVAAKELALSPGAPGARRLISYDPSFDPTDHENYSASYRMMIKGGWQNFVE